VDGNGLFFQRDLQLFKQTQLDFTTEKDHGYKVTDGSTTSYCSGISVETTLWADEVLNAPLNKRGWVLQERLLPPRNVHFCRREVFWECCEQAYCETFAEGLSWLESFYANEPNAPYMQLFYSKRFQEIPSLERRANFSKNAAFLCRISSMESGGISCQSMRLANLRRGQIN
jgi:hypothetical protein